jgi:hypothetical protein
MSLKMQAITVTGRSNSKITATVPAEHVYPFIIHKPFGEWVDKENGDRKRYSSKIAVTHLYSGGRMGLFKNYEDAFLFVSEIQHHPIWLMPTPELLSAHPDWVGVCEVVTRLKASLAIE